MIKEFVSQDQDFSVRTSNTYLTLAFAVPATGLTLVALTYALLYQNESRPQTKADLVIEGISYMPTTSIVISLLVCAAILIGLLIFLKSYYQNREIVVGLTFNDQAKELTIRTKTIRGQEYVRTHPYSELLLKQKHLSDGMTSPMYNTLTLVKGKYLAGHVYMDHFTWDDPTLSELKMKLRQVIEQTEHSF